MKIIIICSQYFEYDQTKKIKQQTTIPPHSNRPKGLLLKASSYLSIKHSNITSYNCRDSNTIFPH